MNGSSKNSFGKNALHVLAGVSLALLFINISKAMGPSGLVSYDENDPSGYYYILEKQTRIHEGWELAGLFLGFFAGSLLTSLIATHRSLLLALLIPPITLFVELLLPWEWVADIVFSDTKFVLPVDVIILAMPLWMGLALLAYQISRWLKLKKEPAAIVT